MPAVHTTGRSLRFTAMAPSAGHAAPCCTSGPFGCSVVGSAVSTGGGGGGGGGVGGAGGGVSVVVSTVGSSVVVDLTLMALFDGTGLELTCVDVEMVGTVGDGLGAASGAPQAVATSSTTRLPPATPVDQMAFFGESTSCTIGADGRNHNPLRTRVDLRR